VQVEIAQHYMDQKRWAEAKEYAEAAAQTWAGWAMNCAARCHEGLENWDQAELWTQRQTERYPNVCWPNWYLFCKRTGHGDLRSAQKWTEDYLAASEKRPDMANQDMAACFYWMNGAPKKALDLLGKSFAANASPATGVHLALIADELGEKARRDAVLEELCTKLRDKAPKTISLCQMMRDELADASHHPFDLGAVDHAIESFPEDGRGNAEFLVGRYLLNRGKADLARKYLKRCADSPKSFVWLKAIAADSLQARSSVPKP